jgi:tetratricopeptide (TPR) repeat protein
MQRRRLLRTLALAPAAWRLGESVDLHARAEELFRVYTVTPPAELHERARRLLPEAVQRSDSSMTPVRVDLACLAALTGYTSGQRDAGFMFSEVAESLAEQAARPELIARAAGVKAVFYSAEMGIGRPHEAAALLQRAADNAEPGVVRAWALANLAPELAALKQRKAAFQAIDEADRQWGRGYGYGLFSVDGFLKSYSSPGPVIGMTGRTLAALGAGRGAITELAAALSLPSTVRLNTIWHVDSALAHMAAGDCDRTCNAAMTALKASKAIGYGLGIQRVKNMRARFPSPWEGAVYVRALDEYLAQR